MKGRNKYWGTFRMVSQKQIELSLLINSYRKKYNMSQKEFADICNTYGKPHNVKFNNSDICSYELMKKAPRTSKYQILCNVLNI